MKEERQAAVQAVLEAGHIPAGMELFASGSESQLETIRNWIDESDVFLLILGGRYGTVEPQSKKSYIELEFDHAIKKKKSLFSIVVAEEALNEKVKVFGVDAIERAESKALNDLRERVLSRISSIYHDSKDIKLAVLKSLREKSEDQNLTGWMRASRVANDELLEENRTLRKALENLPASPEKVELGFEFPALPQVSEDLVVTINDAFEYSSLVKVKGSWADFFPIFASSLDYRTNDWNGEYYFSVDTRASSIAFAKAVFAALKSKSSGELQIDAADFDRLKSYYIEAGLMGEGDGSEPFTDFGRKLARRVKINIEDFGMRLSVVEGKLPSAMDDDIPF